MRVIHCLPIERSKPHQFVLTYLILSQDLFELREIQFAGSTLGASSTPNVLVGMPSRAAHLAGNAVKGGHTAEGRASGSALRLG